MKQVGLQKPKVVVIDDADGIVGGHPGLAELQRIAEVVVLGTVSNDEFVDAAWDASVIIPFRERRILSEELLERLPGLLHIAQTGGGVAHLDLAAAKRRGISYSLTPGASAPAVAELVIGLIVDGLRGLRAGNASLRGGAWERPLGREISEVTFGVLGAGATGAAVADRIRALGGQVLVASRRPDALEGRFPLVSHSALFEQSDVVSIHVELSSATTSCVGEMELDALGPKGGLINVARAAIVDSSALLSALENDRLGWAGLDVFDIEPPSGNRLIAHPRVFATPHLGWRTRGTLERYVAGALSNATKFLHSGASGESVLQQNPPTTMDDRNIS